MAEEEEMYMVLPSNASPDVFPENKTGSFRVQLQNRLNLTGEWKVGLLEVHYPGTLFNVLEGDNEVTVNCSVVKPSSVLVGLSFEETLRELRQEEQFSFSFKVPPGHYTSVENLATALNNAFVAQVRKTFPITMHSERGEWVFDGPTRRGPFLVEGETLRIDPYPSNDGLVSMKASPGLARVLGWGDKVLQPLVDVSSVFSPDLLAGMPPQCYAYMNIIRDQIVGHTKVPLLRAFPLILQMGGMGTYTAEHPIYVDLKTKSFDIVEIDLRDHAGRLLPFEHGTSCALVHFKRKYNGS